MKQDPSVGDLDAEVRRALVHTEHALGVDLGSGSPLIVSTLRASLHSGDFQLCRATRQPPPRPQPQRR
jgi:hypothetical protein